MLNIFSSLGWKYYFEYSSISYEIFVFESIWCLGSVTSIIRARLLALNPDITYITSCRNALSIDYTATGVFVFFGQFFYGLFQTNKCIVLYFNTKNDDSCLKFQPRVYS